MMIDKISSKQTGNYISDINCNSKKEGENVRLIRNQLKKCVSSAVNVSDVEIKSKIIDYNIFRSEKSALGECSKKELKQEKKAGKKFLSNFKSVANGKEINSSNTENINFVQFLGWHGTSKAAAQRLINEGLRVDYEPSEQQLKNNINGEGFYVVGNLGHANSYALRTPQQLISSGEKKGEVIEVWGMLDIKEVPSVFDIEASRNKDYIVVRPKFNKNIFFTPLSNDDHLTESKPGENEHKKSGIASMRNAPDVRKKSSGKSTKGCLPVIARIWGRIASIFKPFSTSSRQAQHRTY
ncbi:hypothetical protein ACFFJN_14685 [Erwinia mallotivora]|uniref:hypothetical protein n=1 Tax=Erwinia mallotivora TaxID=69222 RepID=UPI0035E78B0D